LGIFFLSFCFFLIFILVRFRFLFLFLSPYALAYTAFESSGALSLVFLWSISSISSIDSFSVGKRFWVERWREGESEEGERRGEG